MSNDRHRRKETRLSRRRWILLLAAFAITAAVLGLLIPFVREVEETGPGSPIREPIRNPAKPAREARDQPSQEAALPARRDALKPAQQDLLIKGRFVDRGGDPVKFVSLEIRHGDTSVRRVSNRQGSFEVPLKVNSLLEFNYTLMAHKSGYAYLSRQGRFPPPRILDLGDLLLERGATLSGRVVNREVEPFAGATVFFVKGEEIRCIPRPLPIYSVDDAFFHGPAGPRCGETATGPDGTFVLRGVTPGLVRVWAGAEGFYYQVSPVVHALPGEVISDLLLTLRPLLPQDRIEGVIRAPDGSAVPGARIKASFRMPELPGRMGGFEDCEHFTADDAGRFRIVTWGIMWRAVPRTIEARDPQGRFDPACAERVPFGTLDLQLRLPPSRDR